MRHIGFLARSADGAAPCPLEMEREGARRFGAHQHAEITLSMLKVRVVPDAYERGDLAAVNPPLRWTCQRLRTLAATSS